MNIQETFDKYEDETMDFNLVKDKFSNRRDLHAFILLDKLIPNGYLIIRAVEHDQIWIEIELKELEENLTEAMVLELLHCGVHYDKEMESLYMFS